MIKFSSFPDNLEVSKLLVMIFRAGLVQKSPQNMPWRSFFDHLELAKMFFCQKLTFFKRITRNGSDNPRSFWSIESI